MIERCFSSFLKLSHEAFTSIYIHFHDHLPTSIFTLIQSISESAKSVIHLFTFRVSIENREVETSQRSSRVEKECRPIV